MERGTEKFHIDYRVLGNRDLVDDVDSLDESWFGVVHGDALGVEVYVGFAQQSGLREFLGQRVVCDSDSGIEARR